MVHKNRSWFLIFLVALTLRLAPVIAFKDLGIGLDDMYQYDMLARSIASGNGFRWYAEQDLPQLTSYLNLDLENSEYDPRGILTSFRPPLYPAFLALIYLFSGITPERFFIARLVQAFLATALIPLTYALARRLFPGTRKIASLAAWFMAVYPMLVIYPLSLATENLFFVLLTSAVLSLVIAIQASTYTPVQESRVGLLKAVKNNRWYLLAGLLLGMAGLTRSVSLGLAGIVLLWLWFGLHKRKQAVLVFAMVILVVSPWMVRNSLLHGRFIGVESALGYDLYVGYHPEGTGTFQYPQSLDLMTMLDDGLRDEVGRARAVEFIREDPGRFFPLVLRRAGYFFGLERRALSYFYSNNYFGYIRTPLLLTFSILFCLPFVFIALSSLPALATLKWNQDLILVGLVMGGYILPHLVIIAEDRFHLALLPFLAILASFFWVEGKRAVRTKWMTISGKWVMGFAMLGMLLLLANWILELLRDAEKLVLLFGPFGNQTFFPY